MAHFSYITCGHVPVSFHQQVQTKMPLLYETDVGVFPPSSPGGGPARPPPLNRQLTFADTTDNVNFSRQRLLDLPPTAAETQQYHFVPRDPDSLEDLARRSEAHWQVRTSQRRSAQLQAQQRTLLLAERNAESHGEARAPRTQSRSENFPIDVLAGFSRFNVGSREHDGATVQGGTTERAAPRDCTCVDCYLLPFRCLCQCHVGVPFEFPSPALTVPS
jgi:hypothetical protein